MLLIPFSFFALDNHVSQEQALDIKHALLFTFPKPTKMVLCTDNGVHLPRLFIVCPTSNKTGPLNKPFSIQHVRITENETQKNTKERFWKSLC